MNWARSRLRTDGRSTSTAIGPAAAVDTTCGCSGLKTMGTPPSVSRRTWARWSIHRTTTTVRPLIPPVRRFSSPRTDRRVRLNRPSIPTFGPPPFARTWPIAHTTYTPHRSPTLVMAWRKRSIASLAVLRSEKWSSRQPLLRAVVAALRATASAVSPGTSAATTR